MKRIKPELGEIYHIYNRGVDKRNIFNSEVDYVRFIHNLFEFNDINPAPKFSKEYSEVGLPNIEGKRKPREILVEILAFCLMPNHFHLMVREIKEGGITKFMRKLGTGYTNSFNQKNNRSGVLFQGKYKIIRLEKDQHFIHLPFYIHLNPLDIIMPEWREYKLPDYTEALMFLMKYRWSSLLDYIGKNNFPSVTQRDFLLDFFGGIDNHKKQFEDYLKNIDISPIRDINIE